MTMKNNYGKNNNTDTRLGNKFEKLNLSQSEESFEEYTERELNFIDKYKPMTMNRMTDEEIYDIIIKYDFNEEKIEREITEFKKLISFKGDDYGWNIIDKGNKKKLFLNEANDKKDKNKSNRNFKNNKNEGYNKNYNNKGYYNSYNYKNNYNPRYQKNYSDETNPSNNQESNNENTVEENQNQTNNENYNSSYQKRNYYNNYNRGYNRGRGRARTRIQGRGGRNYSYNYNYRDDFDKIIEKDLNTEQLVEIKNEVNQNIEAQENKNNELEQSPQEVKENISIEKKESSSEDIQNNEPVESNLPKNSNTLEDLTQSPQHQKVNEEDVQPRKTEKVEEKTISNNNSNNSSNNQSATEKQNIFNNDNSNPSKLKNLIDDVETELKTKTVTKKEENIKREIQVQEEKVTYSKETQENNNFGISGQQKKNEEHIISNASSFNFFSKPQQKAEPNINTQTDNFHYTAQNNSTNKFNNQPSQPKNVTSQNNTQVQQPSTSNKTTPQPINQSGSKDQQTPNHQQPQTTGQNPAFNQMMGGQNMYPSMGEGFIYPGTNPSLQPGMPYLWYYNPSNGQPGAEGAQNVQQPITGNNFSQNGGMPFIPYPIPYYVNPMMYQQQDSTKEDSNNKARKNNYYSTPTGYPGMNANQTDTTNPQAAQQGTPYTMPYIYNPALGMNQMMGVNPAQPGWNHGMGQMSQMGIQQMQQQMNMTGYDPQNYQNVKNDQQNPNMYQYKYQN